MLICYPTPKHHLRPKKCAIKLATFSMHLQRLKDYNVQVGCPVVPRILIIHSFKYEV